MHEYRLETNGKGTSQEEGWVICRVFKKQITMVRKMSDDPDYWFDEQISFVPEIASPTHTSLPYAHYHLRPFLCKQELDQQFQYNVHHDPSFLALPQLESPNTRRMSCSPITPYRFDFQNSISNLQSNQQKPIGECTFAQDCEDDQASREQVTDWRVLDKFVASQLSQEEAQKESSYSDGDAASGLELIMNSPLISGSDKQELSMGHLSASSLSCPIDL